MDFYGRRAFGHHRKASHTYGERSLPVALHGAKGSYPELRRMKEGKKVIVPATAHRCGRSHGARILPARF